MERRQAFKFELRPNGEQKHQMRCFGGSCRYVFNKALALQKERFERGEKKLSYAELCREITGWRNGEETPWLKEAPVHPLQQTLKDLDRAYRNFFAKRAEFPKFKKKGQKESFRYPDPKGIKLEEANSRILLPKLGWIRYRKSREVLGVVKNVTVSQCCGKWFAAIQTQREVEKPLHPAPSMVGVDLGIAKFATLSNGKVFEPTNSFKKNRRRLAHLQRRMKRKKKFSNNWKKAQTKVKRLHQKIACIRNDYLHKTSHEISKNHAIVVLEDLKVANMSKSASGSIENPGRNVKAKSGLNRSILDQGWYELRRQLEYKEEWRGGLVIAIAPQNTSQRCAECQHVSAENRKTQAAFECEACGHAANADLNAARNILAAGHAVLACGEKPLGSSAKQEPSEATQALAA
jgi:putative transposase